jgi:ParB family transcriptional regulator, chromosome partitioning protein
MSELQSIKLADLVPSPFNPRKILDDAFIDELADSIRSMGVRQPLSVRKMGAAYEIVAGEQRYHAALRAKLKEVPCLVREMSDVEAREEQLVENLQRRNVTPLEEAAGYQELLKAANSHPRPDTGARKDSAEAARLAGPKLSIDTLAERVGKSRRYVYARLELLKLSPPVQKALAAGRIEPSVAQELVPLKPEQQKELLEEAQGSEYSPPLTVKEVRQEVETRYREKTPAELKREAQRREESKRFAAQQAKRDAAWKKQQAKSEAERALRERADRRALELLWPKLKAAGQKDRQRFMDWFLDELVNEGSLAEGLALATGKPAPEDWQQTRERFRRLDYSLRFPLAVWVKVAEEINWEGSPNTANALRWAKIDRKKLFAEEKKKAAAAAKAAAPAKGARKKGAGTKVQTSATGSSEKRRNIAKGKKRAKRK